MCRLQLYNIVLGLNLCRRCPNPPARLPQNQLHAKTMRGLAKREASAGKRAAPKTAPKARGR